MVDYNELKKKFKAKTPADPKRRKTKAAVKAIAREYELKRAELEAGAPLLKKGPLFYGMVILVLVVIGALVVPQLMNGGIALGKKRIERNDLQARKAMNSLSVALGRFKFHVGQFPTTEEGLAVLAYRKPKDLAVIRRRYKPHGSFRGWDGPYVDHIVQDPWGHDYVYETRPEGGNPILYSKGPDGRAGTTDDILPDQLSFEAAFRDTTWTNGWAPAELRGIVVAPDEETKKRVQDEMRRYDTP